MGSGDIPGGSQGIVEVLQESLNVVRLGIVEHVWFRFDRTLKRISLSDNVITGPELAFASQ